MTTVVSSLCVSVSSPVLSRCDVPSFESGGVALDQICLLNETDVYLAFVKEMEKFRDFSY